MSDPWVSLEDTCASVSAYLPEVTLHRDAAAEHLVLLRAEHRRGARVDQLQPDARHRAHGRAGHRDGHHHAAHRVRRARCDPPCPSLGEHQAEAVLAFV